MAGDFLIRAGGWDDVETIVAHRRAMFYEMGYRDEAALDRMCDAFRPWLVRKVQNGEYLAWFAADANGPIAAGLGLWLMDWPPHVVGPGRWRGNIVNVYARPESRRIGLARRLMHEALGWCRLNQVGAVILHSSEEGRSLYEKLGFRPTNEMRLLLESE